MRPTYFPRQLRTYVCLTAMNGRTGSSLYLRWPRATALAREGGREGLYLQRPRETSGGGHGTHDDDDVAVCLAFSPLGRLLVEFRVLSAENFKKWVKSS